MANGDSNENMRTLITAIGAVVAIAAYIVSQEAVQESTNSNFLAQTGIAQERRAAETSISFNKRAMETANAQTERSLEIAGTSLAIFKTAESSKVEVSSVFQLPGIQNLDEPPCRLANDDLLVSDVEMAGFDVSNSGGRTISLTNITVSEPFMLDSESGLEWKVGYRFFNSNQELLDWIEDSRDAWLQISTYIANIIENINRLLGREDTYFFEDVSQFPTWFRGPLNLPTNIKPGETVRINLLLNVDTVIKADNPSQDSQPSLSYNFEFVFNDESIIVVPIKLAAIKVSIMGLYDNEILELCQ